MNDYLDEKCKKKSAFTASPMRSFVPFLLFTGNWISLDFGLLVRQNKTFEVITSGSVMGPLDSSLTDFT